MPSKKRPARPPRDADPPADLRIIGGSMRGRKLTYGGHDAPDGSKVTRPMKHRVRECIFNLISTESKGRHAIDLFAGTGALGLEALSRGAPTATFIEKHVPSARVVQANIDALQVADRCELLTTSAFLWGQRDLPDAEFGMRSAESEAVDSAIRNPQSVIPWLVFCSPPYAFFIDRADDMLTLITAVYDRAPPGSILVVEADERFDFQQLPADGWDVRAYPPAVVGVLRKAAPLPEQPS